MAIENKRMKQRGGTYGNFNKSQCLDREINIVTGGDENASDGRAAYVSFSPGVAKRLATYEDMVDLFEELNEDELEKLAAAVDVAVNRANIISGTLETKLKNGDFRGAQGESGVVALSSGMFCLTLSDSVLYCEYLDGEVQPKFEFTDGALYYVIS